MVEKIGILQESCGHIVGTADTTFVFVKCNQSRDLRPFIRQQRVSEYVLHDESTDFSMWLNALSDVVEHCSTYEYVVICCVVGHVSAQDLYALRRARTVIVYAARFPVEVRLPPLHESLRNFIKSYKIHRIILRTKKGAIIRSL